MCILLFVVFCYKKEKNKWYLPTFQYFNLLYSAKLNPVPIMAVLLAKWNLCSLYVVDNQMKHCFSRRLDKTKSYKITGGGY